MNDIKKIFEKSTGKRYPNDTSFVCLRDFEIDSLINDTFNSLRNDAIVAGVPVEQLDKMEKILNLYFK